MNGPGSHSFDMLSLPPVPATPGHHGRSFPRTRGVGGGPTWRTSRGLYSPRMTILGQSQATDRALVRVVYPDEEFLPLLELNDRIADLGCLLMVNALGVSMTLTEYATRETDLVGAGRTLASTSVSSISRNSPLEIVLWPGSGITEGTVAAQPLV